jgi:hypothetical protein
MTRGRPRGTTVPFLKSKNRFLVPAWVAFVANGMLDYPAAYIAIGLFKASKKITVGEAGGAAVSSTENRGKVIEHADHLVREAREIMERAQGAEYDWVVASAQHLAALAECISRDDQGGADHCLNVLSELGWKEKLGVLLERLAPGLKTNLPPTDTKLKARTLAKIKDWPRN